MQELARIERQNNIIPEFTRYFDVVKQPDGRGWLCCRVCNTAGYSNKYGHEIWFSHYTQKGFMTAVTKVIRHISSVHNCQVPRREHVIDYVNSLPVGATYHETEPEQLKFIDFFDLVRAEQEDERKLLKARIDNNEEKCKQLQELLTLRRVSIDSLMHVLRLTEEDIKSFKRNRIICVDKLAIEHNLPIGSYGDAPYPEVL